jgi:diamine N-acetyltransferase
MISPHMPDDLPPLSPESTTAPDKPRVRRATAEDLERVLAIGRGTYGEHFAHLWTPEALRGFYESSFGRDRVAAELESDDTVYLLAEQRSQVVGFAKIRHPRPVPGRGELSGVELQKLYLAKNAAGRGLGSLLMAELLERAARTGQPLVWLEVLTLNTVGIRFYERHGFAVVGQGQIDTGFRNEPVLVMVKSLG